MGTIRVTQQLIINRVLNNLSHHSRKILKLQDQLSTGLRVNQPSDDPLATQRAIAARTEIAINDQYLTNMSTSSPYLLETETAIMTVERTLERVRELVLQGANGTNSQQERNAIAIEVNQLLEETLTQANHFTTGRYIFGGTRSTAVPFVTIRDPEGEATAVDYVGNDGHFGIEIEEGIQLTINETGADVFTAAGGPDNVDVFQVLIDVRANLRNSDFDGMQTNLGELSDARDQFLVATARIGAVQRRVEDMDANIRDNSVQLHQVLSDNIDADFGEVTVGLNAESNAFQASLNAAAQVIQPSLLQFI